MRCAVLMVGSLLWDDGDHGERDAWRKARLSLDDKMQVKAPIYYGRKSRSRGDTFTMTLGMDDSRSTGILVPCIARIGCMDNLMDEVLALWKAEAPGASSGNFHRPWGCVGASFSASAIDCGLAGQWTRCFQAAEPPSLDGIDAEGRLTIPWPRNLDGRPVADFDVVLATATRAEVTQPDVPTIAEAWLAQEAGYERYFFENVRHGIRTLDDAEIWRIIQERQPLWLKPGAYEEAVEILRAESRGRNSSGLIVT